MKDWLVAALILGGVLMAWKGLDRLGGKRGGSLDPEVITNPVYLEMRINMEITGRTLESVALVQTADDADCQRFSRTQMKLMDRYIGGATEPRMTLKSIECKAQLSPRNASLFDNEPSFVTYISAARGQPQEREQRWILWGTSVEESELICDMVPELQANLKGKVSCIHAQRS